MKGYSVMTREADYAIRAMLRLAMQEDARILSTTVMAEDMDIPYRFLRRILLKLVAAQLVISTRGKHGGLRLACPAGTVTLYDIIKIMDPDAIAINDCLADPEFCSRTGRCVVHTEMHAINEMLRQRLSGVTLAQLVQREKARTCQ